MSKTLTIQNIPSNLDALPDNVKRALALHLGVTKNKLDLEFLVDWYKNKDIWKEPKVSFDTFLDDPAYLGCGKNIYPTIRKMAKQIIHNKYSEAVIVAGIGSGKTTAAELVALYEAHHLLCLRDPHNYYHLAKDKPITIINMGTTATQALDVTFAGIKNFMLKSPWFLKFSPHILNGSIRFVQDNILLMSGNSKSTTPLGYNVFCAILDEAAFYLDNDNKQIAKEIYDSLQSRITSRFNYEGLLMMISSPKYEGDFVMQKLEEARKLPDLIYAKQLPIWKCKPVGQQDRSTKFYFNSRRGMIDDNPVGKICSLDDTFDKDAEIWEIPGQYKKSFLQDPEKAKRDYVALPSATIETFMPHPDIIKAMFTNDDSPVLPGGGYKFSERPLRVSYYIHIDLALNRKGKGDHAGFSMAHFDGYEVNKITQERQKKVVVDLAERIGAGVTGQIEFADVRNRVYALKKMGYNIVKVTLDSYQSSDTVQIFRSKGIRCEILSVDRTVEPYQTLKELINSGRIKCHKSEILFDELRRLEITKSSKVDHPPSGTKDVADSVCGAVFNVMENASGEMGVSSGGLNSEPAQPGTQAYINQQKEKYARLHKMQEEGFFDR